jgi:hypothetical protein
MKAPSPPQAPQNAEVSQRERRRREKEKVKKIPLFLPLPLSARPLRSAAPAAVKGLSKSSTNFQTFPHFQCEVLK